MKLLFFGNIYIFSLINSSLALLFSGNANTAGDIAVEASKVARSVCLVRVVEWPCRPLHYLNNIFNLNGKCIADQTVIPGNCFLSSPDNYSNNLFGGHTF